MPHHLKLICNASLTNCWPSSRQQKRKTEAPSAVKQLDNFQTLAAGLLQPATAVQVHMHPKLGVFSAHLPASNVALPTNAGNLVMLSDPKWL